MPEDDDDIDLRVAAPAWEESIPGVAAFVRRTLAAAVSEERAEPALAVLLTDDAEMRALNAQWRGQDKPTNVLSFPAPDGFGLGDIALGHETVAREAAAQGKSLAAHTAHLLVHGFLHLLGYDHEGDGDAAEMEARERAILSVLGIADPYVVEMSE
jgi:probable rRNA maturation factor